MEEIKEYWDKAQKVLKTCYFLKDGKFHGLLQHWYDNGQKRIESNYVDGKLHGLYQSWYENGKKNEESNYVNDRLHGLYQFWYENSKKRIESWYVNGVKYESEEEYEESRIANKEW